MTKATILIVEDEAIIAADLAGTLRRLGYGVSGTTGLGEEAIELAREQRPDLVLMDIRLAGAMDGIEAAETIRRELDLPVIYLTAHSDRATLERAKLTDPFGYILKPFEELGLETHVEMALYKHQAERKLRQAHDELELRVEERTRELKAAEQSLREINETLERRVAERTTELSTANVSLLDSRRAALNMMEDAVIARRQAEEASTELRGEMKERKRVEEALRESESRVRRKLDSILSPEGDIGSLDLADIIDAQSMQSLMDNFYKLTRMPMAMIDLKGRVLVGVGWQDICTKFHRVNPETCENCIESDTLLSAGVPEGEFKLYKCKNNMWDVATPIMVGGKHFGNFFMGQFFFEDEPLDYELFRTQARKYGFDEKVYITCLESVPRMSREALAAGMSYFMELADMISRMSYSNLKLARSLTERDTLAETLRKSYERTNLLAETASELLASDSPQEVVDSLCRKVMSFLDCHAFFNFLVDEEAGRLHLNACAGIPGDEAKSIEWLDYGTAVCGCAARDACRIVAEDIPNTPDPRTELVKAYGIQAYACHPLLSQGRVIGTLSFGTRTRTGFSGDDLSLMKAVTDQVAIAMERKRAAEALQKAHDELEARVRERTEELAGTVETLLAEIAERERAEENVQRMNRLNTVLSGTRQAIARTVDRETLFNEFCRIAVEDGGFLLAWVGLMNKETGRVERVAARGATAYLDDIRITAIEEPAGEGPTGISVREGTYCICNDFLGDPATRPWHERGRAHGIRASASVALKQEGKVVGALTLYADKADFFDQQHVELLQQMGEDVSFALDNLVRETLLRESEKKYRSLFEESKDMIYLMDADNRLVDVNPAGIELLGYTREELAALDLSSELYSDPADRERFLRALYWHGFVRNFEMRLQRKDGETLHVLKTASVTRDDRGEITGYRGIIHDITERKRLEQELHQAQKMESIGLLAGGVAHDFNNLMTAVTGYGQIIRENIDPDNELLMMCSEQLLGAAERAVELTRNLLAFGRKQIINPKPVPVNEIIINVTKLLARIVGEDIEFQTNLTSIPLMVLADRGQIDQVLVNLVANARDAMPDGGKLCISTRQEQLDQRAARRCELEKPGEYALITVADTGTGMDERTRARIFEPFFTTKEPGKGTGLGLSIIYGIVKQHNGAVAVESEPGKGTTFTIYLPVESGAEAEARKAAVLPAYGTETILLAEDDAIVRHFMEEMLKLAGFTVITATNGEEAVSLFRQHRDKIALVMSDVIMPRKNGKEVFDEITRMAPGMKFIFTSGYTDDIIHKKGLLDESLDFLMKPVSKNGLLQKVRAVLDR